MSTNLELSLNDAADLPGRVIDIRYGQVGLVQVRVHTTEAGAILDELTGRVAAAPNFFRRTAVCLDLSALAMPPDVAEVRAVIDAVRRVGMLSVGLAGGSAGVEALSCALNLPVLSNFRSSARPAAASPPAPAAPTRSERDADPAPDPEPPADPEPAREPQRAVSTEPDMRTLIHGQTVRSGQRLYARHRDLIVTASVGAGAEVMADGCLHVYGSLRGRAMAGARGELGARVFCQEFHAELVSIAGVFRVFEAIPAELAGKPVQAWLAGEHLHFARVGG